MVGEKTHSVSNGLDKSPNTGQKRSRKEEGQSLEDFIRMCVRTGRIIEGIFACMLEARSGEVSWGNWLSVSFGEGQICMKYGYAPKVKYMKAAKQLMRRSELIVGSTLYSQLGDVVGSIYDAWRATSRNPNVRIDVIISISRSECRVHQMVSNPEERGAER